MWKEGGCGDHNVRQVCGGIGGPTEEDDEALRGDAFRNGGCRPLGSIGQRLLQVSHWDHPLWPHGHLVACHCTGAAVRYQQGRQPLCGLDPVSEIEI